MLTPELIKEIHENAVAHGWWEGERDIAEIYALIHSELSEALEEYRNDRPMIYFDGSKPKGIAFALADAVIRILDYVEQRRSICMEILAEQISEEKRTLPRVIVLSHMMLSRAWACDDTGSAQKFPLVVEALVTVKELIRHYLSDNGLDLYEIIRIKHEYNKTRP